MGSDKVKFGATNEPTPEFWSIYDKTHTAPARLGDSALKGVQLRVHLNKRKREWNGDDEVFISGPAEKRSICCLTEAVTPKASIMERDVGTIEPVQGDFCNSFSLREGFPWKTSSTTQKQLYS